MIKVNGEVMLLKQPREAQAALGSLSSCEILSGGIAETLGEFPLPTWNYCIYANDGKKSGINPLHWVKSLRTGLRWVFSSVLFLANASSRRNTRCVNYNLVNIYQLDKHEMTCFCEVDDTNFFVIFVKTESIGFSGGLGIAHSENASSTRGLTGKQIAFERS